MINIDFVATGMVNNACRGVNVVRDAMEVIFRVCHICRKIDNVWEAMYRYEIYVRIGVTTAATDKSKQYLQSSKYRCFLELAVFMKYCFGIGFMLVGVNKTSLWNVGKSCLEYGVLGLTGRMLGLVSCVSELYASRRVYARAGVLEKRRGGAEMDWYSDWPRTLVGLTLGAGCLLYYLLDAAKVSTPATATTAISSALCSILLAC